MLSLAQKGKVVLSLLLALGSYQVMSHVMVRTLTGDEARVRNFYLVEKNSLDMVLIGASTVYTDYSAPLAWKEFGITSYSLATNSAPMGLAKSMLKEVLQYQNPKLILIDINGILYNDVEEAKESNLRRWIDNMPLSKNKIETIQELIPKEERVNYYVPLMKYHGRWKNLDECIEATKIERENKKNPTYLAVLGDEGETNIVKQHPIMDVTQYKKRAKMHKASGDRLITLLKYLKEENIHNVVFTNMPRFYSSMKMVYEKERFNEARKQIADYGYDCIDLDDYINEIGLDANMDYYNQNHLNLYGKRKNTRFLVNTLLQTYDLKSDHTDQVKKRWDEEYQGYTKVQAWIEDNISKHKKEFYTFFKIHKILNEDKK